MSIKVFAMFNAKNSNVITALAQKQVFANNLDLPREVLFVGSSNPLNIPKYYKMPLTTSDGVDVGILCGIDIERIESYVKNLDGIIWITYASNVDPYLGFTSDEYAKFSQISIFLQNAALNGVYVKAGILVDEYSSTIQETVIERKVISTGMATLSLNVAKTQGCSSIFTRIRKATDLVVCYNSNNAIASIPSVCDLLPKNIRVDNSNKHISLSAFLATQSDIDNYYCNLLAKYLIKLPTSIYELGPTTIPRFHLYDFIINRVSHSKIVSVVLEALKYHDDSVRLHATHCLAPVFVEYIGNSNKIDYISDECQLEAFFVIGLVNFRTKKLFMDFIETKDDNAPTFINKNYETVEIHHYSPKESPPSSIYAQIYHYDMQLIANPKLKYSLSFLNAVAAERRSIYGTDSNINMILTDVINGKLPSLISRAE